MTHETEIAVQGHNVSMDLRTNATTEGLPDVRQGKGNRVVDKTTLRRQATKRAKRASPVSNAAARLGRRSYQLWLEREGMDAVLDRCERNLGRYKFRKRTEDEADCR